MDVKGGGLPATALCCRVNTIAPLSDQRPHRAGWRSCMSATCWILLAAWSCIWLAARLVWWAPGGAGRASAGLNWQQTLTMTTLQAKQQPLVMEQQSQQLQQQWLMMLVPRQGLQRSAQQQQQQQPWIWPLPAAAAAQRGRLNWGSWGTGQLAGRVLQGARQQQPPPCKRRAWLERAAALASRGVDCCEQGLLAAHRATSTSNSTSSSTSSRSTSNTILSANAGARLAAGAAAGCASTFPEQCPAMTWPLSRSAR